MRLPMGYIYHQRNAVKFIHTSGASERVGNMITEILRGRGVYPSNGCQGQQSVGVSSTF